MILKVQKKFNTGKIEKLPGTDESSTFSPREYWIVSDKCKSNKGFAGGIIKKANP
jgi:hypothetical protein